jgi:5-methylcytosine-specific restriction endonuclease McrA
MTVSVDEFWGDGTALELAWFAYHEERKERAFSQKGRCFYCNHWMPYRELLSDPYRVYGAVCRECLPSLKSMWIRKCVHCGKEYKAHQRDQRDGPCRDCKPLYGNMKQIVISHNHRARRLGLPATLTVMQWRDILVAHNYKCVYCGKAYEVLDHFVPLARGGGTHEGNVVPSCHNCNAKKGSKRAEAFFGRYIFR